MRNHYEDNHFEMDHDELDRSAVIEEYKRLRCQGYTSIVALLRCDEIIDDQIDLYENNRKSTDDLNELKAWWILVDIDELED